MSKETNVKLVAENRRARFDYEIGDRFEAGIELLGTEVRSLRNGLASVAESHVQARGGEMWLHASHIQPCGHAMATTNHEPMRVRRLLLKSAEIARISAAIERKGMTVVPLRLYFNARGRAKVEIALARGKKAYDKRETSARRDADRRMAAALKDSRRA
jgi:SsrA-binding protein